MRSVRDCVESFVVTLCDCTDQLVSLPALTTSGRAPGLRGKLGRLGSVVLVPDDTGAENRAIVSRMGHALRSPVGRRIYKCEWPFRIVDGCVLLYADENGKGTSKAG